MPSAKQQDLYGQSCSLDLLSERGIHSTTKMATPRKATARSESLPPEIRNMIYRILIPPAESCKVLDIANLYLTEILSINTPMFFIPRSSAVIGSLVKKEKLCSTIVLS